MLQNRSLITTYADYKDYLQRLQRQPVILSRVSIEILHTQLAYI